MLSAAGLSAETPSDVLAWAGRRTSSLLLLTLNSDSDWRLLAQLREVRVALPVVALMDAASVRECARAIQAGARSLLPRSVAAETLRLTVKVTMEGQAVLPAEVAALLAAKSLSDGTRTVPTDRIDWLRQLASGMTVAELAAHVGYSERAMFRLLNMLYRDLGVGSRIEALMLAHDRGWI